MPAKSARIQKPAARQMPQPEERETGLWVDVALISRLHGRRSPLAAAQTIDAESQRLLHYADVILGTDKKEKFVSAKPTKDRNRV